MQKIVREQLKMYSNNILSKNKTINDLCFDILDKEEDVRLIYELADIIIKDRLANYRSKHSKL